MKQLCFSTASTNQEGPLQFLCLNQPFVQVDDDMNDRWDYLLADLNDETPARHVDENLRYPELNQQQRFNGQTRHTGQRMMDQRNWMPPASSGYMDIFNNHNMSSDLATSGGFPGSAFVNPSIANVSGNSNVTSMLPPANHLPHTSNATRNGLPQVKTEPGYVASQSQPMASLDLNTHTSQQQATSSSAPSLSASRFNGHSGHSLDMDDQERKKLERKRARNRAAASKCRQRKLERIQELEGQVQQERQRNAQLQTNIERAQQELQQVRQSIEEHRQAGCQISGFN